MKAVALALLAVSTILVAACAPASRQAQSPDPQSAATVAAPKRFTASIRGNPPTVYQKLNPKGSTPGVDALERLVETGLTVAAPEGNARLSRLAEEPVAVEDGSWKIHPDGTMDTRWTIRQGAVWQDGARFTTEDLVFTARIAQDKRLPILNNIAFASLSSVDAVDSRTIVAHWNSPYIYADKLFSFEIALPVARHLLEPAYLAMTDQEQFIAHSYWSHEFIGTGPYKIKEWEPGSHLRFEANPLYIAGRPKIDEITVKFIPDPNTVAANILAGEVETPWGGRIGLEWAQNVANSWKDGKLKTELAGTIMVFNQFIDPNPAILAEVEFRRAMIHALDRQSMADTFMGGRSFVAHSFLAPNEPEYGALESAIVKYEYDPRRSLQILEGLGYARGGDGALRDRAGQRLVLQIRTSQGDLTQEPGLFATADNLQQLGVEMDRSLTPPQRASDFAYRTTFPAFDLKRNGSTMDYGANFHTRLVPLPENNFLAAGNNSRYGRPEMDAIIDRYFTTIPWNDRMQIGRQIIQTISEQVVIMGLYHDIAPTLIPNRLLNRRNTTTENSAVDFIHEWDLRS